MDEVVDISAMIEGVIVEPLRQIGDERGAVLHMLRNDSPLFAGFGEIYFSEVRPGVVKAWKRHKKMTQHFAVPVGSIRLVIFDDRQGSPTSGKIAEIIIGRPDNYHLVRIPPMVWYGFKAISRTTPALIANCADMPHDPDEAETQDVASSHIPFAW